MTDNNKNVCTYIIWGITALLSVVMLFMCAVCMAMMTGIIRPESTQSFASLSGVIAVGIVTLGIVALLGVLAFRIPKVNRYNREKIRADFTVISFMFLFLIFIFISNISGLFGLRPPTADYGVTLPLGLITFGMIQYNNIKYNKFGAFTDLFKPLPLLFPINLIGELATPFSLSLRLFGNVLSGTVMMSLIYSLLSKIAIGWPGILHIYFDVFSGAIQTYVFCMLTMVFVSDKMPSAE